MTFSVSIQDVAGNRVGPGPIATATRLLHRAKLDQAGECSFDMPATDPRAALFPPNVTRLVRARVMRGNTAVALPRGIVRKRTLSSDGRTLNLSGPDLAGALVNTHVKRLVLQNDAVPGTPKPAANVLGAIMAFAPGWTITGTPSRDVYYKFGDETVLAALGKIAELTGDHWRLHPTSSYVIEWLPTTPDGFQPESSGLRAIMQGEGVALEANDDVCLIAGDVQIVADSYQRITRVLLRGGGNADAQLTINATTRYGIPGTIPTTVSADYTSGDIKLHIDVDPAKSYIASISAESGGEIIEGVETFRDIVAAADTPTDQASAANALVDAGIVALRRRLVEQVSYRFRLTKVRKPLVVGTSLRLVARGFVDGYGWLAVNEDVLVLEAAPLWETGKGEPTYDVQVTQITVDRWPVSTSQRLANTVVSLRDTSTHIQPAQRSEVARQADTATYATSAGVVGDSTVARLNGAQTFSGTQTILTSDAATTTRTDCLVIQHETSANPGVGFGSNIVMQGETSAGVQRTQSRLRSEWAAASDGSRRGSLIAEVFANAGTMRGLEIGTNGTVVQLGFFGATAVIKPTALTASDASTVDATYGSQEAAVINNLRTRVNELETKLRDLGLLT